MRACQVEFFLPFLKDIEVTGNAGTEPSGSWSYATEHLGYLGRDVAKLTGRVEVHIDLDSGKIVPFHIIGCEGPDISLETDQGFDVLAHQIKFSRKKKGSQRKV